MNSRERQFDIKFFIFAIILVLIQILSSMFQFFPTFVGVFFCYILLNIEKEEKFFFVVLSFLYLSFYELNKGFFLFSYVILFIIFYYLFAEKIRSNFKCKNCVIFIYVATAYIGHFFLNELLSYILHKPSPNFSLEYLYYIGFDFIIGSILFGSTV